MQGRFLLWVASNGELDKNDLKLFCSRTPEHFKNNFILVIYAT